jgi:ribosomal-protein-alanine N-acetyltransferase
MILNVTSAISLTELRRSDRDSLVEWLADREIYDRTLRIPYPYTLDDADRWIGIVERRTEANGGEPVVWAIRGETGRLIGGIGLDDLIIGQSCEAELGYWLAKPWRGRGLMTAVVETVCRHAFENLGLTRITAHVFWFNDASARVLKRCGFQQEGFSTRQKEGQSIEAKLYARVRA